MSYEIIEYNEAFKDGVLVSREVVTKDIAPELKELVAAQLIRDYYKDNEKFLKEGEASVKNVDALLKQLVTLTEQVQSIIKVFLMKDLLVEETIIKGIK